MIRNAPDTIYIQCNLGSLFRLNFERYALLGKLAAPRLEANIVAAAAGNERFFREPMESTLVLADSANIFASITAMEREEAEFGLLLRSGSRLGRAISGESGLRQQLIGKALADYPDLAVPGKDALKQLVVALHQRTIGRISTVAA